MLDSIDGEFYIRVKYERPETDEERERRLASDRIWSAQIASKEIAQMESLMRKYKDIAEIKMRNIRECVNVK